MVQKLGKGTYDDILNQAGRINTTRMREIACKLHPKVSDRHVKRLERGSHSDVLEMRYILSDWWLYEMWEFNNKAALDRLTKLIPSLEKGNNNKDALRTPQPKSIPSSSTQTNPQFEDTVAKTPSQDVSVSAAQGIKPSQSTKAS